MGQYKPKPGREHWPNRIEELYNEGKTARMIGKELGVTKNTIIGYIHRHMKHLTKKGSVRSFDIRIDELNRKMDEVLIECARTKKHVIATLPPIKKLPWNGGVTKVY